MKILKKLRLIPLIPSLLLFSAVTIVALYPSWAWNKLMVSRSRKRHRAGKLNSWCGVGYAQIICRIMGIKTVFRFPEGWEKIDPNMPLLMVSNHQSQLDIFILCAYARKLGRKDVRWILKEQLRHGAGQIGHVCMAMECAFVKRKGGEEDAQEVRRCAQSAMIDRGSMLIFPEGHRLFGRRHKKPGYDNLQPPHRGGFDILKKEMKDLPVLSLTVSWSGPSKTGGKLARSGFNSNVMVIEGEIVSPEIYQQESWLEREWERKDRRLGQLKKAA